VAQRARQHGIEVLQPERVRRPEFLDDLATVAAITQGGPLDVAVVVAFGQIFPRQLLDLPRQGCINLHASLLPAWRGAAPIQAAIAAGEAETGVTTMRMEEGLDTGPILLQQATAIGPQETAGDLSRRLAEMGGRLVVETLARLEQGDLAPVAQRDELATYAPRLTRDSGRVDWRAGAKELFDRLRAHAPWPGSTAELAGRPVKIVWARPLAEGELPAAGAPGVSPGTFLGLADGRLAVACGGGTVLGLEILQRPGKRPLAAAEFARGERLAPGALFA
jgi:methionyl-tRNA formyltransferase